MEAHTIQRSQEWYDFRVGKLGASSSGAVLGLSPWQTPLQLYNEMKGLTPPRKTTAAMQIGIDREDEAIDWLNATTGNSFKPAVGTYKHNERIIASLDGYCESQNLIAEIKCSQGIFDKAKMGVIDPFYFAQLQHQMLVYEAEKNLFVAFDGFDGVIIEVERDEEFIKDMLAKELEFLECLDTSTPPAYMEKDHVKVFLENISDVDTVNEYIALKEQVAFLTKLEKEKRSFIEEMIDDGNAEICSPDGIPMLKLTRVNKSGTVDWKNLCKNHGISEEEIDFYRKEGIGYYKYTVIR